MSQQIIFVALVLITGFANAANHTVLELATVEFKPNFNILTDIVPFEYHIHLTVETDANGNFDVYSGVVKIGFESMFDRDVLQFMAHDLKFTDIRLRKIDTNETFRDFNTVKTILNYDYTDDIYLFRDDGEIFLKGNSFYELIIEYTGRIKRIGDKTGFFQSQFYEDGRVSKFVATHFQTKFIRDVIPTFEDISFKPVYFLKLSHHPKYIALSNMPSTTTNHSEVLATTTFEPTPAMSGYLLGFAIGEFKTTFVDNYRQLPFNIYGSSRIMGGFDLVTRESGSILKKFEEYLNLQYQLPKLDFLVLPEYQFAGMENWGLIVFKEAELYGKPNSPDLLDDYTILILIAHEIAHQYFGNLVTPMEWRYAWLSEGFATYLSYKVLDHYGDYDDNFIYTNLYEVFIIDTGKLYLNPRTAKNSIYDVNNKINYCKAGSIIRMVNYVIGDQNFERFLTNYLNTLKFGSVLPSMMIRILETHVDSFETGLDKANVKDFVESWTDQRGSVIVTAIRNYESGDVKLTQEFNTMGKYAARNTTWWIPYNYATKSNRNWDTKPTGWLEKISSKTLNLNISNDEWIIFNKQHTGVYIMNYDTTNWGLIVDELNYGDITNIHVFNRAQILHDLNKLVEYGRVDRVILVRALFYLRHESEYLPWEIGSEILQTILIKVMNEPQEKPFKDMIALLITNVYANNRLQNEVSKVTNVNQIRKIIIRWALGISHPPCLADLEDLSNQYLNSFDGESRMYINPMLVNDMFCHGFQQRDSWNNITIYFANHLNDRDILSYLRTIHCKPYTPMFKRNFMIYQYGLEGEENRSKLHKAAIDYSIKQVENKNHVRIVYECLIENCYDFRQHYDMDSMNEEISRIMIELMSHITTNDLSVLKQIVWQIVEKYSIDSLKIFDAYLTSKLSVQNWFRTY